MARGIHRIDDLPSKARLQPAQRRQLRAIETGQMIVEPTLARDFEPFNVEPLGFLDFETVYHAVPVWDGMKPWEQAPAQLSYHESLPDGTYRHEEYLADGPNDARQELARLLVNATRNAVRVVHYSPFEKTRIRALQACVPELAQELKELEEKLIDLAPVLKDNVYHPLFKGSFSLKVVLPALVPELSYNDLVIVDGRVVVDHVTMRPFMTLLFASRSVELSCVVAPRETVGGQRSHHDCRHGRRRNSYQRRTSLAFACRADRDRSAGTNPSDETGPGDGRDGHIRRGPCDGSIGKDAAVGILWSRGELGGRALRHRDRSWCDRDGGYRSSRDRDFARSCLPSLLAMIEIGPPAATPVTTPETETQAMLAGRDEAFTCTMPCSCRMATSRSRFAWRATARATPWRRCTAGSRLSSSRSGRWSALVHDAHVRRDVGAGAGSWRGRAVRCAVVCGRRADAGDGVRMALGATAGAVHRQVVSQGTKVVLVGVVIGIAVAFAATRLLGALLLHVKAVDRWCSSRCR